MEEIHRTWESKAITTWLRRGYNTMPEVKRVSHCVFGSLNTVLKY